MHEKIYYRYYNYISDQNSFKNQKPKCCMNPSPEHSVHLKKKLQKFFYNRNIFENLVQNLAYKPCC